MNTVKHDVDVVFLPNTLVMCNSWWSSYSREFVQCIDFISEGVSIQRAFLIVGSLFEEFFASGECAREYKTDRGVLVIWQPGECKIISSL